MEKVERKRQVLWQLGRFGNVFLVGKRNWCNVNLIWLRPTRNAHERRDELSKTSRPTTNMWPLPCRLVFIY